MLKKREKWGKFSRENREKEGKWRNTPRKCENVKNFHFGGKKWGRRMEGGGREEEVEQGGKGRKRRIEQKKSKD